MPTQTATTRGQASENRNRPRRAGLTDASAVPQADAEGARISDPVYGLVSVLYHALQGAETYGKYADDAEEGGDDELMQFFEQCRDEELERADQAKTLLSARLGKKAGADEDDDDSDDDHDDEDDEDE